MQACGGVHILKGNEEGREPMGMDRIEGAIDCSWAVLFGDNARLANLQSAHSE